MVFDSYVEDSGKEMERQRRGNSTEVIEYDVFDHTTKPLVQMEKFWPSSKNKFGLKN